MKTKPIVIKKGFASAKLYAGTNKGRPLYCLAYSQGGRRIRRNFRKLAEARKAGREAVQKLATGQTVAAGLNNRDAATYAEAITTLRPTGIGLILAAKEFAEAVKVLAGKGSVLDAARDYAKSNRAKEPKLVREVVDAFLATKEKKSKYYLHDVKLRLGAFATAFAGYIGTITADEIEAWLRRIGGSPRTFNNYRNALVTLFRFAKKKEWLDEAKITAAERVDREDDEGKEIAIFTPKEMEKLLKASPADLRTWLLLGGFAGLRTEEVCRLDWRDVRLQDNFIEITAAKAKTASRRIVPISTNLAAWLAPIAKKSGPVFVGRHPGDSTEALSKKAGVDWKINALRHSYISYRVAEIQDVAKVALEAGNSPAMVFGNYRQLVTPTQATEWFAIMPPAKAKKGKIIEFPKQEAA